MKGTMLSAVVVTLMTLHASACWASKVEPADGVTFTALSMYGQGFTSASARAGDRLTGMTLGGYLCFDWNDTRDASRKGKLAFGLGTEFALGLGMASDSRPGQTEATGFVFDLTADILGVLGRYKPMDHLEFGFFYEPVEVFVASTSGFLGSKMELKAGYEGWQINVARGGTGFGSGFLVPKEGQAIHSIGLQYRAPTEVLYGVQYTNLPGRDASSPSGHALMLQLGYWG